MVRRILIKLLWRVAVPGVVAALLVVLFVRLDILDDPLRALALDLGIIREETTSSSSVLLQELRDVYRLTTVEYIYRTVFPFDYMPEQTDMDEIMAEIRSGSGPLEEILSEKQLLYFDAHNLAEEVGLGSEEFLVLTVRVHAGFDLTGTPYAAAGTGTATGRDEATGSRDAAGAAARDAATETGGAGNPGAEEYVSVEPVGDSGGRRARVRIPEAAVTDIVIEDVDPSTYPYPDVGLNAEEWREVAEFVSKHVEARTIDEGILSDARENARELVRSLLISAGIDQVSFANEENNSANSEDRR